MSADTCLRCGGRLDTKWRCLSCGAVWGPPKRPALTADCAHEFRGWRTFADGRGGEQVCVRCGIGAMALENSHGRTGMRAHDIVQTASH